MTKPVVKTTVTLGQVCPTCGVGHIKVKDAGTRALYFTCDAWPVCRFSCPAPARLRTFWNVNMGKVPERLLR